MAATGLRLPIAVNTNPSCADVEYARIFFMFVWTIAANEANIAVINPTAKTILTVVISEDIIGNTLNKRKTPLITSVEECINALTGVGALIASISQEFIGNCADLTIAAITNSNEINVYICFVDTPSVYDVIMFIFKNGSDAREISPLKWITSPETITNPKNNAISPIIFIRKTRFESIAT